MRWSCAPPGDEEAHVAGFCLAEGIIDSPEDITTLASCEGDATNVVTVTVTPARLTTISGVLERRGFVSQTSCGICGKEIGRRSFAAGTSPCQKAHRSNLRQAFEHLKKIKNTSAPLPTKPKLRMQPPCIRAGFGTFVFCRGCGPAQCPRQGHRKAFFETRPPPGQP